MNTPVAAKVVVAPPPGAETLGSTVSLHVAGEDLLLDGRFDHWSPMALNVHGPDSGTVQILFDVTAAVDGRSPQAGRADVQDLFSYSAGSVRVLGPSSFITKGTLQVGATKRVVEAVVQTPGGHTPFFTLTLPVDREAFAGLWQDLQGRAVRSRVDGQMHARTWLRAPSIALA